MCQALLEIMEPEINKIKESVKQSVTESVTESVTQSTLSNTVKSFRSLGVSNEKILELLMTNFGLSSQKAESFL